MSSTLTLISHSLCPYVQRAAIVLTEKGIAYERKDIDLTDKPDWFLKLSPLGKTPVLVDGDVPIFESAVICEYLEEILMPRLHPEEPLQRARHRSWMEFGSAVLNSIWGFYTAADEAALSAKAADIKSKFEQIEQVLGKGPYFAGDRFSIVDAVFGPVFRYFDVFDTVDNFGCFDNTPKVSAWRQQLSARFSVRYCVRRDYPDLLTKFLLARNSALSKRMNSAATT